MDQSDGMSVTYHEFPVSLLGDSNEVMKKEDPYYLPSEPLTDIPPALPTTPVPSKHALTNSRSISADAYMQRLLSECSSSSVRTGDRSFYSEDGLLLSSTSTSTSKSTMSYSNRKYKHYCFGVSICLIILLLATLVALLIAYLIAVRPPPTVSILAATTEYSETTVSINELQELIKGLEAWTDNLPFVNSSISKGIVGSLRNLNRKDYCLSAQTIQKGNYWTIDTGSPVKGSPCDKSTSQLWVLENGDLRHVDSQRCLRQDPSLKRNSGALFRLRACNGTEEKDVWEPYFSLYGKRFFRLQLSRTGWCLSLNEHSSYRAFKTECKDIWDEDYGSLYDYQWWIFQTYS